MTVVRNRFTNPATSGFYDWPLNHEEEEAEGRERTITHTAPTGGTGVVRQQGEESPIVIKLKGKIKLRTQFTQFWFWFDLCKVQTIYFRNFDNQVAEVQITSYTPRRVRNLKRPNDPEQHHWEYEMEMEVYRWVSGDLHDVGVTP